MRPGGPSHTVTIDYDGKELAIDIGFIIYTRSTEDHAAGKLAGLTQREYFGWRKFAPRLLTDDLAPMGAANRDLAAGRSNDYSSGTLSARGSGPAPHNGTLV